MFQNARISRMSRNTLVNGVDVNVVGQLFYPEINRALYAEKGLVFQSPAPRVFVVMEHVDVEEDWILIGKMFINLVNA